MTRKLKRLLTEWDTAKNLFAIQNERYLAAVKELTTLNGLIVEQAKKENISLKELGRA